MEGVTEEESPSPRGLVVEESRVSEPARAGDKGVVAVAMVHTAPENVVLVVQLAESSDEFGDSW